MSVTAYWLVALLASSQDASGGSPLPTPVPGATDIPSTVLNEPFQDCDGYPPPGGGDGVTQPSRSQTYAHLNIAVFPDAAPFRVESCDTALLDARLEPRWELRRASLLHARAIHLLASGDGVRARADLESAAAIVASADDIHVQRSIGLAIELTNAYAARISGNIKQAETLAFDAWLKRPFSRQVSVAALVAMGPDASWDKLRPVLTMLAALSPTAAVDMQHFLPGADLTDSAAARSYVAAAKPNTIAADARVSTAPLVVLFESLPRLEVAARKPAYAGLSLIGDGSGYTDRLEGNLAHVRFVGPRSTMAMTEEAALLRAAEKARQAGRRTFAVVARRDFQISIDTMLFGTVLQRTDPHGFESRLEVKFMDATPPEAAWRVLDADAVYSALAPIYNTRRD